MKQNVIGNIRLTMSVFYQISYTETMRRSAAQPRSSFALEGSIVVYSSNSTDSTVVSNPSIADIQ